MTTITGDNGNNTLQGGWGGQTIYGLGGADTIYGDPTTAPSAPFVQVAAPRDPGALDGAFRLASATVGGKTYLYATAIEEGGLSAWEVGPAGALTPLFSWTTFGYAGPVQIGGRALQTAEFGGTTYLLSSGLGLSLSAIGADGSLTHLASVFDDAILNIDQPTALAVFETGGAPYVVASGRNGQGISVFRIDPALGFVHVQSIGDSANTTLRLVADLETVIVGEAVFVVATGYYDSGVTVFSVGPGGALTRTAHDTTELNLLDDRLDGAQTLASHAVGDKVFLYVGTEFGRLSVYEVTPEGGLILLESHAGAYRDLQVGVLNGAPRLFAAGAGQDVTIYAISAAGRLTYQDAYGLAGAADVGGMAVVPASHGLYLGVARGVEDGFDLLQATIGGDDLIYGGDGADKIYGGAGADRIYGGAGADRIWGEDGDDFLFGEAGADVIIGGNGDDWIEGGMHNDELRGGAGADTLHGGGGRDRIYGGSGSDWLTGGGGADELYGGIGSDRILGGPGADRLVGNNGHDRLIGGGGPDVLEAGPGADVLDGGAGNDRLKGGSGPDILTGGPGADIFEFAKNSNKDVVTDFNRAEDRIEIVGWPGGYASLSITQQGADALVAFGNVEIRFENTLVADLDSGAFLFT